MKIAFVHDWLITYAGAERVLEQMLATFPDSELFSVVDYLPAEQRQHIFNKKVKTSYIQYFPHSATSYRYYLPLMPHAVERLDLSGYELVISSSHAVAKGVKTNENQLHICMCYSPMRYVWDLREQYLYETGLNKGLKGYVANYILDRLQKWDTRNSDGVNCFIAISEYIRDRIANAYHRDATVIYPPVDTEAFELNEEKDDYYLTVSRLVPYKKVPMIMEAFSKTTRKLIVIGDGPEYEKCKKYAGDNIQLLGYQEADVMRDYMRRAKAFVFAADEDFGIAPLEAQACGTPVIAYGKGAVLETIRGQNDDIPTGVFYEEQTVDSLIGAVEFFEKNASKILPLNCRKNAERFSAEKFKETFERYVREKIDWYFTAHNM